MQRYAFSREGTRIFVEEALAQVDYVCPECLGKVRVKRGAIKIAHFFHLEDTKECRWKTRFHTHRVIQEDLVQKLGLDLCTVEQYFPEISRVADIAFHPFNIVFEIQLSPISSKELEERTLDYWSIGWHVIWVLHIEQFGSRRASSAEETLQAIPHYFTDIGSERGSLWDEASYVYKKKRIWFFPLMRKKLSSLTPVIRTPPPCSLQPPNSYSVTNLWFEQRKTSWSCALQGDFLTTGCPQNLRVSLPRPYTSNIIKRIRCFLFLLWMKISGSI